MKRVAVIQGGISSEREVSLRTGAAVAAALRARGHEVSTVDGGRDLAVLLAAEKPEVAFVALHGRYGEDGCVQGILELMGIPYTGSGVLASALAMDKVVSKKVFRDAGLPVPEGIEGLARELESRSVESLGLSLPVVVKPRHEGSSVGVTIVRSEEDFAAAVRDAAKYGDDVVVERYIAGREINVGVLDGEVMGIIEIVVATEFYDYAAKYERNDTRYIYPAPLDDAVEARCGAIAAAAHELLGCRGVTRTDLMVGPEGDPYLLEVNTLPGMTATSLIPKIARGNGMSFEDLCEALLASARVDL